MNNLSSFGVQELNAKEIKETQGGCGFFEILKKIWDNMNAPRDIYHH